MSSERVSSANITVPRPLQSFTVNVSLPGYPGIYQHALSWEIPGYVRLYTCTCTLSRRRRLLFLCCNRRKGLRARLRLPLLELRQLGLHRRRAEGLHELAKREVSGAKHTVGVFLVPTPLAVHGVLDHLAGELVPTRDVVEGIEVSIPVQQQGNVQSSRERGKGGACR